MVATQAGGAPQGGYVGAVTRDGTHPRAPCGAGTGPPRGATVAFARGPTVGDPSVRTPKVRATATALGGASVGTRLEALTGCYGPASTHATTQALVAEGGGGHTTSLVATSSCGTVGRSGRDAANWASSASLLRALTPPTARSADTRRVVRTCGQLPLPKPWPIDVSVSIVLVEIEHLLSKQIYYRESQSS